jgi:hypothetical protein
MPHATETGNAINRIELCAITIWTSIASLPLLTVHVRMRKAVRCILTAV